MFKSQYHVEDLIYSTFHNIPNKSDVTFHNTPNESDVTFHNTPNESDVFIEKSSKNIPDRKT